MGALWGWFRSTPRASAGLAAVFAAVSLCLPWVRSLEDSTEDLRFVMRGTRPTRSRIVLALADSETFSVWRDPLAVWSRHVLDVVRQAERGGARGVAVDITLSAHADEFLEDTASAALRTAGLDSRRVLELQSRFNSEDALAPDTALAEWIEAHPGFVILSDDARHSLTPALRSSGATVASVVADPSTAQRWMEATRSGEPMLPVAVAARAQNRPLSDFGASGFRINYLSAAPGRSFTRIPLQELAQPSAKARETLRGAMVLVGLSDPSFNDLHPAIGGREFPGTEILAHAAATLIDGRPLRRWPGGWEALLVLCVGGVAAFGLTRVRFAWGALSAMLLLGSTWGIAQWAFTSADFLLPLAASTLAVALPFAVFHTHQALQERETRQEVERVFGQYLTPRVRDFLLASPQNRSLGGTETEGTVLFFDLRDSTAFAEERTPEAVIQALNELYGRTIPCIEAEEGLVLKYNGDGFVALFGAPMPRADHAAAGIAAAEGIRREIRALNAERAKRKAPPWRFACGVHSGPLVFGNLGIAERPEFTAIGDTVNVAARLQDLAKQRDQEVVISDATFQAAGATGAGDCFAAEIRGRKEPVLVRPLA